MKHNIKITLILIAMFLVTQLIGLYVIHVYNNPDVKLPYGMQPPEEVKNEISPVSIIFAFIIAITLFFILMKLNADRFIRLWFFLVTIIALALSFNAILINSNFLVYASFVALIIAIPLAYFKIFQRNMIIHNLTELLIYPGVAAVFVPILNVFSITILLLAISIYDIWAVWHSKFMQKMAHYQINNLKFFTGFFIPYAGKKERQKIKLIRQKYANKSDKILEKNLKKSKIKINLAILGGGDVIFPIITAGVFYKVYNELALKGLVSPLVPLYTALIIIASATLSLSFLFIMARKGKFYPAMPFLTIGMYLGMIINWLLFSFF